MFKFPSTSFSKRLHVKSDDYLPLFFNLTNLSDRQDLDNILEAESGIVVYDQIESQICELIKCQHPSRKLSEQEIEIYFKELINGFSLQEFGNWVYYSWSKRLVHILPKKEFIQLRTSRNNFKITPQEQKILSQKKVGIIGLSVGKSIAMTMAMERSFGEVRLADFDEIELSNLNRVHTSLHNLGVNKAVLAAREIVEVDPYLNVKCFTDGINEDNINQFFEEDGLIDLLVEESDSFEIKVLAREKARGFRVPVLMDTSDRGLVDVERFDLEPEREIFHGRLKNLKNKNLKNLSSEEKVLAALEILGVESLSTRMKASMLEINQQISTWPQLATSVFLGGAIAANTSRRIFLNQFNDSGRYNVDVDELISDEKKVFISENNDESFSEKWKEELIAITEKHSLDRHLNRLSLDGEILDELINAAILAPSGGNAQPWFWISFKDALFLFYDPKSKKTLLDYNYAGTRLALGAASENLILKANMLGLDVKVELLEEAKAPLTAVFSFVKMEKLEQIVFNNEQHLGNVIPLRLTNRRLTKRVQLPSSKLDKLKAIPKDGEGRLAIIESEEKMEEMATVLANIERVRFMHDQGHKDLFDEIRWTKEESEATKTGIDLRTIEIEDAAKVALKLAEDPKVIQHLKKINGGSGFDKMMKDAVKSASALGCVFVPKMADFWSAGRIVQRIWLKANQEGIAFQPLTAPIFLINRFLSFDAKSFNEQEKKVLETSLSEFQKIFSFEPSQEQPVFLFRLSIADAPSIKSFRLPLDQVFLKT